MGSRVFTLTCPLPSLGPELMATLFQPKPRSEKVLDEVNYVMNTFVDAVAKWLGSNTRGWDIVGSSPYTPQDLLYRGEPMPSPSQYGGYDPRLVTEWTISLLFLSRGTLKTSSEIYTFSGIYRKTILLSILERYLCCSLVRNCPVDLSVSDKVYVDDQSRTTGDYYLYIPFRMFRFLDGSKVRFSCNVIVCQHDCPWADCGDYLGMSYGRKKRSASTASHFDPSRTLTVTNEVNVLDEDHRTPRASGIRLRSEP
ncbi:ZP domain-containing protein [Trichonephila clavipes]|nr:ZP domain-containing protein [Trichonephila clavipes]